MSCLEGGKRKGREDGMGEEVLSAGGCHCLPTCRVASTHSMCVHRDALGYLQQRTPPAKRDGAIKMIEETETLQGLWHGDFVICHTPAASMAPNMKYGTCIHPSQPPSIPKDNGEAVLESLKAYPCTNSRHLLAPGGGMGTQSRNEPLTALFGRRESCPRSCPMRAKPCLERGRV